MKQIRFLGCVLVALSVAPWASANAIEKPTYTQHVAKILNDNCVQCHRPGDIAPMSLRSYEEVRPWIKSIAKNVEDGKMPPWHADPGYGPWKNDRSLSEQDVETITQWARAGGKQGPKADAPPVPEFGEGGWRLGEPDLVLTLDAVDVVADGPDEFYDLVVPTGLTEDRWLEAVEVMPGEREVVHHVILWKLDGDDRGSQGWIGAWAAGADPITMPEGTGRMLKAGSSIIGDMHYHPSGTAATDQTKIGLHFASDEEVEKELINLWVMNDTFVIPAGHPNYQATSTHTFAQDSHITSLTPHLHYRGKDFKYTLTTPDGTATEILAVSDYDFNWQTVYEFEEPIAAPKGSRIDCVAHWDNSEANLSNPDPTKDVRFGPESYDEMMIGFVDYIVDEGVRPAPIEDPVGPKIAELAAVDPGRVFEMTIPMDGKMTKTGLHIPASGDGGWYVPFAGGVARAPVLNITWEGNVFQGDAQIPNGTNQLEGTVNAEAGTVLIKMTDPEGRSFPIPGKIAE